MGGIKTAKDPGYEHNLIDYVTISIILSMICSIIFTLLSLYTLVKYDPIKLSIFICITIMCWIIELYNIILYNKLIKIDSLERDLEKAHEEILEQFSGNISNSKRKRIKKREKINFEKTDK